MQSLHHIIKDAATERLASVPGTILSNLKPGFGRRPYQMEAFSRFIFYFENEALRTLPAQLLFHMATGSGKTLIMAGCILYLYQQGYRNFIFFVNSANIIEKTRDNFLNPGASKYLFAERIYIDGKHIRVKEVPNFQATNQADINIVFSTIQGLHTRLNIPKENAITYEDFSDKNIVLISDEAHHINASTKKGAGREVTDEAVSWEDTVNKIFRINSNNLLLEFTATADFSDPGISNKYRDKLIFDYPLKQFRADGYSKDIKVLQSGLPEMDRVLQAIILSQYRRKLFEKNKLLIKPVVLFKARTIRDSHLLYDQFSTTTKQLNATILKRIRNQADNPIIKKAFTFFDKNNITLENLSAELKDDFSPEKCLSVNSKNESEAKQIAVNTLEDASNKYRAVFAVDKLNEGWDVLNLFDIVRLYNTRDAKNGKPGKTTMSEAQLIGRGARYCPFKTNQSQSAYIRKFDHNPIHEMKCCEELYYHSGYNPTYIQELNTALEDIGIKEKDTIEINLTPEKKTVSPSYHPPGAILSNGKKAKDYTGKANLTSRLTNTVYQVSLNLAFPVSSKEIIPQDDPYPRQFRKEYPLNSFGIPVIRKAMNKIDFYRFSNLKDYFPQLLSGTQFITSGKYLGNIKVKVEGAADRLHLLTPQEKLAASLQVLQMIADELAALQFTNPIYKSLS